MSEAYILRKISPNCITLGHLLLFTDRDVEICQANLYCQGLITIALSIKLTSLKGRIIILIYFNIVCFSKIQSRFLAIYLLIVMVIVHIFTLKLKIDSCYKGAKNKDIFNRIWPFFRVFRSSAYYQWSERNGYTVGQCCSCLYLRLVFVHVLMTA